MDSRTATITTDSSDHALNSAVAAHLSTVATSVLVVDPDYDPWITDVRLWVDGHPKDFTLVHAITSTNRLGGVILMHTIDPHDENDISEFVVIRFDDESRGWIHQEVMTVPERYWLQNKGLVLHQLTNYLFLS